MKNNDTTDQESVGMDMDAEEMSKEQLIAAINRVCGEYETVQQDFLANMREDARQQRVNSGDDK